MKRALLAVPLFAALFCSAGCASQDAALSVTFAGQYRIPTDADTLLVDVLDGTTVIKHVSFTLTASTPLPATLTVVESGGQHPQVRINATLKLTQNGQTSVVGIGTATGNFQSGQTESVLVTLVPPS